MSSKSTGEVNCKIYSEGREALKKTKTTVSLFSPDRNGTDSPSHKPRQSSQTPEYVKRTARLFETIKTTEEIGYKNGITEEYSSEAYVIDSETRKTETRKISLDCLDGEYIKKPSYVGVSCSNSGYRNVINYDSKLREGFWSANNQRESLVLSNSRLRENSPMRRDFDFKSHNGDSVKITDIRIEKDTSAPANGVSQSERFVNISTSTKTISTFRNSKDIKEGEGLDNGVNGVNGVKNSSGESKVNLKQILNGKNEEPNRKGYSNLGFSPKILKSPEKNCNSFLKSISSFENNCRKSQTVRSSTYSKAEQKIDSNNSIIHRIERLYGPGALAQGFYTQKSQPKLFEKPDDTPSNKQTEISKPQSSSIKSTTTTTTTTTNNTLETPPVPEVAEQTEKLSNGHVTKEPALESDSGERNGRYFLRLLKKETDRLEELASFAESELENGENLPEEISGKLRAAAGKARLLVCQKLNQFEGLCHKNLNEKPGEPFPTTGEDLAGFWDMVMLQVDQVYGVFSELEELKKNNWKITPTKKATTASPVTNGQSQLTKTTPKKSTPTNPVTEKQSQKSETAKKAREEGRRKLLEERRKKMKELKENKIVNGDSEVEIFAK